MVLYRLKVCKSNTSDYTLVNVGKIDIIFVFQTIPTIYQQYPVPLGVGLCTTCMWPGTCSYTAGTR